MLRVLEDYVNDIEVGSVLSTLTAIKENGPFDTAVSTKAIKLFEASFASTLPISRDSLFDNLQQSTALAVALSRTQARRSPSNLQFHEFVNSIFNKTTETFQYVGEVFSSNDNNFYLYSERFDSARTFSSSVYDVDFAVPSGSMSTGVYDARCTLAPDLMYDVAVGLPDTFPASSHVATFTIVNTESVVQPLSDYSVSFPVWKLREQPHSCPLCQPTCLFWNGIQWSKTGVTTEATDETVTCRPVASGRVAVFHVSCGDGTDSCYQLCGNGVIDVNEDCDPAGVHEACVNCAIQPGFNCSGSPSICQPIAELECLTLPRPLDSQICLVCETDNYRLCHKCPSGFLPYSHYCVSTKTRIIPFDSSLGSYDLSLFKSDGVRPDILLSVPGGAGLPLGKPISHSIWYLKCAFF